jgi:CHAT domain-containing protein/Flp pilus assembly protein TadD
MRRALIASLLLCVVVSLRARATQSAIEPLVLGIAAERQLAGAEIHAYSLEIAAGQFVLIALEQRGVDVTATLLGPDGTTVVTADDMDDEFRPETIAAIAEVSGVHRVEVRRTSAARTDGRYAMLLKQARTATADDQLRVETERTYARGRKTRQPGRAASWTPALADLSTALEQFRRLSDRAGEVKTLVEIAITQYYLSMPETLATAQEAARLARDLGDGPAAARALRTAGNALVFRGDIAGAIRAFEESTAISRQVGHKNAEAKSLNDAGIAYRRQGDLEKAVALYERALPLARETRDAAIEANIVNNLGVAYKNLGDHERALVFYEQSLANRRAANDERGQWFALGNVGYLYLLMGDYAKAETYCARALEIARKSGDPVWESTSLDDLGSIQYARGDYEAALATHNDSLARQRKLGALAGQAFSLSSVGRTLQRLGRFDAAQAALGESLEIFRRIRHQLGERDVLGSLADLQRERGNLGRAVEYSQASVDLDEAVRARITSPQLRTSFVASQQDNYERLIELLQQQHAAAPQQGFDRRALDVSERARARVLLDSLLNGQVDLQEGVDATLLARERNLQKQLDDASTALSGALAEGGSADERAKAAERVEVAAADYQELRAEIRRQSPKYAAITQPQPLDTARIQQDVLDDDTVLLEFALGEDASWLWAVTRESVSTVQLPERGEIETAVRTLHRGLAGRQREAGESAAAYSKRIQALDASLESQRTAVGELLLGGIAGDLQGKWSKRRLAIVPSGPLEYLPFAALRLSTANPASLAERHEIVYVPSASVLAAVRRETSTRRAAGGAVAIVADPVFEQSDPRLKPSLGTSAQRLPATDYLPTRHLNQIADRGGLARLPFSRDEAAAIASLARLRGVFEALDFKASRSMIVGGAIDGHRIVHFATHGVFDASSPALSGLVLSLLDERGRPQDGFLRLNDIYNLQLDADLVVLSACQTALGREIRGEGLVGLSRAFMYAGAPRIVASLWQVSDFATAELMKKFYRRMLVDGMLPAAALRAAQLEMAADPRWKSPYFWAGFVLQGDWR